MVTAANIPTFFERGIVHTEAKRDRKLEQLAAVRSGEAEPAHGMSLDEAVTLLLQDIADFDRILIGLRKQNGG